MRVGVVGGGILGLATARLALDTWPSAEVTVLEKEASPALHQTGHNSGVVHAGLYYPVGSLKARLCRRGMTLMRDFCRDRKLPYDECGKIVVALREDELARLNELFERSLANGVEGARMLSGAELREIEPAAAGIAAIHSPRTAITDYRAVSRALATEIAGRGGEVRTRVEVARVDDGAGVRVTTVEGDALEFDKVVVCAGLHADRLATASGEADNPRIVPFRGEYWQLRPEHTDLVRGLIYPVPDPTLPFLGVHLTRKVDGSVWIGPNAVPALALEGYRRRDASLRDMRMTIGWPGARSLMWRYRRMGAGEIARSASKRLYIRDARRYVPGLRSRDVIRAPAGVRAQAVDEDGAMVDDFRLGVTGNVVWVRNAPSPAATASLAIAEELLRPIADSVSRVPGPSSGAR
jgi:L-2-hydroxyglutarate oxidase LhgO